MESLYSDHHWGMKFFPYNIIYQGGCSSGEAIKEGFHCVCTIHLLLFVLPPLYLRGVVRRPSQGGMAGSSSLLLMILFQFQFLLPLTTELQQLISILHVMRNYHSNLINVLRLAASFPGCSNKLGVNKLQSIAGECPGVDKIEDL